MAGQTIFRDYIVSNTKETTPKSHIPQPNQGNQSPRGPRHPYDPNHPLAASPRISPNKLSYRRLCMPTPSAQRIREREKQFVNDAVVTERRRTKYKDIIPKYDAAVDANARQYFQRPDVKRLISVTCTLKPVWHKN
ncbi:hypothetical protein CAPTEDRAFT_191276 [Capitella teleta]|uniref:Uncharacterized protein n=1 Tax=Capitella teleta TaxID=283909 RepID=R7U667_CAPTE|nr:hypothetical protein CAPTEDRAFT_191276 [Capitella teleta]|eukprot:ELU01855.1 hypothetical protein CAPTEDRAFT_191276 [Capitella teleta]